MVDDFLIGAFFAVAFFAARFFATAFFAAGFFTAGFFFGAGMSMPGICPECCAAAAAGTANSATALTAKSNLLFTNLSIARRRGNCSVPELGWFRKEAPPASGASHQSATSVMSGVLATMAFAMLGTASHFAALGHFLAAGAAFRLGFCTRLGRLRLYDGSPGRSRNCGRGGRCGERRGDQ